MYALHIIFVSLAIVCFVVLMFIDNKKNVSCDISIPFILLFALLLIGGVITGVCADDTRHYRENHEPTFGDYQAGNAVIKTYIDETGRDTICVIKWKGRQEGKR